MFQRSKAFLTRTTGMFLLAAAGSGMALAQTPQLSMGGYARNPQLQPAPQTIAMMDADRDQAVTRGEYMAFHAERFERMDRDRDGRIDRDEWRRSLGGIGGEGTN